MPLYVIERRYAEQIFVTPDDVTEIDQVSQVSTEQIRAQARTA